MEKSLRQAGQLHAVEAQHGQETPADDSSVAANAKVAWIGPTSRRTDSDAYVPESSGGSGNRKLVITLLALVVIAAVAVVVWMMVRAPATPTDPNAANTVPLEFAAVDVSAVAPRTLSRTLPLSGTISPVVQTTLKSKVAGDVEQVTVREGQDVRQGDVIARIDTRNLQAQYDREMASVEKARADLNLATLNRDKNKTLLELHYISQNTYDSTESAYAGSLASVKLAEASARLAKVNLDDAVVRAPFDGTIAKRLVEPGGKVSPDIAIVMVVDLRQMLLEAALPAADIPSVSIGQRVAFKVGGFGEREFVGTVQRISPMTEENSRAIKIYIAVANADRALKGGMFAQGDVTVTNTQPVLSVEQGAVREEAGANYVYSIRDDKIFRTPIMIGSHVKGSQYVEVRSGLANGDRVILANLSESKVGSKAVVAK